MIEDVPQASNESTGDAQTAFGVPVIDLYVVAAGALITVAWLPGLFIGTAPRNAVALALLPLGIVLIGRRAIVTRDRAFVAALALLGATLLCAIFAVKPRAAFVGQMPEWSSVVAYATTLAWWASGRLLSDGGRRALLRALTAGALLNGAVGVAQLLARSPGNELFFVTGRASGLFFNPVFYATFMVGVAAWWTCLASDRPRPPAIALAGGLTCLAALSGGRAVLGAAGVVWVIVLIRSRRNALLPVGAGVLGIVTAEILIRAAVGTESSIERFSTTGTSGRTGAWAAGLRAFAERPLLGWGPANAELGVMRNLDFAYMREAAADEIIETWWDPHNIVILVLVSGGVVGACAVGYFVWQSLRGSRDVAPLLAVLAMSLTWLLQPAAVLTLPLGALILGAAVRPSGRDDVDRGTSSLRRTNTVTSVVGVVLALAMLGLTLVIDRELDRGEVDSAASLMQVFGGDPSLEAVIAQAYQEKFARDPGDVSPLLETVAHAERAVELFPTASGYSGLADVAVDVGDLETAERAVRRALELERWDVLARLRLVLISRQLGDLETSERELAILCETSELWCEMAQSPEG